MTPTVRTIFFPEYCFMGMLCTRFSDDASHVWHYRAWATGEIVLAENEEAMLLLSAGRQEQVCGTHVNSTFFGFDDGGWSGEDAVILTPKQQAYVIAMMGPEGLQALCLQHYWPMVYTASGHQRVNLVESDDENNPREWRYGHDMVNAISQLVLLHSLSVAGSLAEDVVSLRFLKPLLLLRHLNVSGNGFTDNEVIHNIGTLELRELNLSRTRIGDKTLTFLSKNTCLETLHLDGLPITDAGIAHLSATSRLTTLTLVNAQITGSGIAALSSLEYLDLSYSTIQDKFLAALAALPHLKELILSHTDVTDNELAHLMASRSLVLQRQLTRRCGRVVAEGRP